MDLKAPCHEVGGVKFGDIHHVDIEQRLCGINLSVVSSHDKRREILRRRIDGGQKKSRVIDRLCIPCRKIVI